MSEPIFPKDTGMWGKIGNAHYFPWNISWDVLYHMMRLSDSDADLFRKGLYEAYEAGKRKGSVK